MTAYRVLVMILITVIIALQFKLLSDHGGIRERALLQQQIDQLKAEVRDMRLANNRLREKVQALKQDPDAMRAVIRRELGMVRPSERFVRVIER